MVRMKDDRLPIRYKTQKLEGIRKRGRPQLRLEDCVNRDLRKAEVGGVCGQKRPYSGVTTRTSSPLKKGNQRKNKGSSIIRSV